MFPIASYNVNNNLYFKLKDIYRKSCPKCPVKKLNPFQAIFLFLYPLKTSENQRFSNIFRGYRKRTLV